MDLDEAYETGWRAFDRGGAYGAKRRAFARRAGGEHLVEAWEAGWEDNFRGRGFGHLKTCQETSHAEC